VAAEPNMEPSTVTEWTRALEQWFHYKDEDARVRVGDVVLFQPSLRIHMLFDNRPDAEMRLAFVGDGFCVKYTHASRFAITKPEPIVPDVFRTKTEFIQALIAAGRRLLAR